MSLHCSRRRQGQKEGGQEEGQGEGHGGDWNRRTHRRCHTRGDREEKEEENHQENCQEESRKKEVSLRDRRGTDEGGRRERRGRGGRDQAREEGEEAAAVQDWQGAVEELQQQHGVEFEVTVSEEEQVRVGGKESSLSAA